MRRKWVVLLVVVSAVAIPVAVWAAVANRYDGNVDRQRARYQTTSLTTSSTAWHSVPMLSVTICAINEVSATVSVNLSGARARFRVVGEQGNVIKPGPAEFAPRGTATESFSYTFVTSVGTFEADDRHSLTVQWRSPTGAPVTLTRGDFNVLYELGTLCT